MTTSRFLIYGLFDPRDGELRYVGKSECGLRRGTAHMWPSLLRAKTHKTDWIKSLLASGQRPTVAPIQEFHTNAQLCDAERYWIAVMRMRGCRLTNATDGGEGTKGHRNPPVTPEMRARMSAAQRARAPATAATNRKIADSLLGRPKSAIARHRMSIAHLNKPLSPAHRAAILAGKGLQ